MSDETGFSAEECATIIKAAIIYDYHQSQATTNLDVEIGDSEHKRTLRTLGLALMIASHFDTDEDRKAFADYITNAPDDWRKEFWKRKERTRTIFNLLHAPKEGRLS